MNSIVSISFAVLFLIKGLTPAMDICCELKKLPNLLEHYQQHSVRTDESFVLFVYSHYVANTGDSQETHDEKEHDKLPFHGSHHCCHPSVFYVSVQYFSLTAGDLPIQYSPGYYQAIFSSQFPEAPFQPPKALV